MNSKFNSLEGNTISQCNGSGVTFDESSENSLKYNIFLISENGVLAGEGSRFLELTNNTFTDNDYGVKILYGGNNTIQNNLFQNNEDGIHLRSTSGNLIQGNTCSGGENGIYLYGGQDNMVTRNWCSGSSNSGINLSFMFYSDVELNILGGNGIGLSLLTSSTTTVVNNTLFGNDIGILYVRSFTTGNARYNNIIDNAVYGSEIKDSWSYRVNASNSYWGDSSGPSHPAPNPTGLGDAISDNIDFQPFSQTSLVFAMIESIDTNDPEFALDGENVTFRGYGYSYEQEIVRYVWWSSVDGEIYNGTESSFTRSDLSNGTHRIHFRVMDARGEWSRTAGSILMVNGRPQVDLDNLPPWILEGDDIVLKGNVYDDGEIVLYVFESSREGLLYQGVDPEFTWKGPSWGQRIIYFRVMDDRGAWSNTARAEFGVYAKPQAFIDSIEPRNSAFGEPIFISGHGTDDLGLSYYLWRDAKTGDTLSIAEEFELVGYANGTHTVEFRVRNTNGIWSDWVSGTFSVNGKPFAEILSISPNPAANGDMVKFQGIGYDDSKVITYLWIGCRSTARLQ